jgi:hypothetical protein
MSTSDFHLLAQQLGREEIMLDRALDALEGVDFGETAFLSEAPAWTPAGSGKAFARLVAYAQERNINIITSLNLGGELIADLPGHDEAERYHALVVFTRHGTVHVPQAKISTQSFEMDRTLDGPGIGVTPYGRSNRVCIDLDEQLMTARFFVGSDLMVLQRMRPSELACDLLVVLGKLANGGERAASRLLGAALAHGVARTAILVNAFDVPRSDRAQPLAIRVEEVFDATRPRRRPAARWRQPRSVRACFHVYEDGRARDFAATCRLPRRGRVPIPRSRWEADVSLGDYPVTIVL